VEIGHGPESPVIRPMCKGTRRLHAKQSVGRYSNAHDGRSYAVVEMESGGLWVGLD